MLSLFLVPTLSTSHSELPVYCDQEENIIDSLVGVSCFPGSDL